MVFAGIKSAKDRKDLIAYLQESTCVHYYIFCFCFDLEQSLMCGVPFWGGGGVD